MAISLRDFRSSDVQPFYEMDQACFAPEIAYSLTKFRSILRNRNSVGRVAEDSSGRMAGFILAGPGIRSGRRYSHVITIDVAPEWRRQGIGRMLIEALERRVAAQGITRLLLEVAERNVSAYAFYSRLGFVETGLRMANYYPDGDGAIEMEKKFG